MTQTSCFDPFKCHKKKITKALPNESLDFSDEINKIPVVVESVRGQKRCDCCMVKVQNHIKCWILIE